MTDRNAPKYAVWWIEHGKEKREIELIEEAKRAERLKAKKQKATKNTVPAKQEERNNGRTKSVDTSRSKDG
ncbi:hypothetical protein AB8I23_003917 [Vibrio alginolyticus]